MNLPLLKEVLVLMYPGYDLYRILQQLCENVAEYRERLIRLEQSMEILHEAVHALRDKSSTHVDKIEYHFDQLKVEKLDGTLNIGITPQASGLIEQVITDQQAMEDVPIQSESDDPFTRIAARVHQYLAEEASRDCKMIEIELNKTVNMEYRKMMIEDVERQIDGRIKEYIRRQSSTDPKITEQLENEIVAKVKRDIQLSLRNYLQHQVRHTGGEQGEA